MRTVNGPITTIDFMYDFAINGGAVSSINMGVFLPINSYFYLGFANIITALTSGGAATIAVGHAGSTGALIAATAVASWTINTVLPGVDLTVAPVKVTEVRQLQVTIATAALTAGKFSYRCYIVNAPL